MNDYNRSYSRPQHLLHTDIGIGHGPTGRTVLVRLQLASADNGITSVPVEIPMDFAGILGKQLSRAAADLADQSSEEESQ